MKPICTKSRIAKLDLYPTSLSQISSKKFSPCGKTKKSRNKYELLSISSNNARNKTVKGCKAQKKLVTSLKNARIESSAKVNSKVQKYQGISKIFITLKIESNLMNSQYKFLDCSKKQNTRNANSSQGLCYS